MESFAIGSVAKNSVSLNVKSRHSQFEAEKIAAKEVLKIAENMVKQASTTDNPAKGIMNILAITVTSGTKLK